jgi:hypothetical protein
MRLAKGGPLGLRAAFTRLRVIPTCTFCACQSSVESAYLELQVDSLGFHRVRLREFDLVLHIFLLQWREFSIVDDAILICMTGFFIFLIDEMS